MRLGEQCPYITPCGWCSRQEKPCDGGRKKKERRIQEIKPPVLGTSEKPIGIAETFAISATLCKTCKAKWDKLLTEDEEAEIEFCESCQKEVKAILGGA